MRTPSLLLPAALLLGASVSACLLDAGPYEGAGTGGTGTGGHGTTTGTMGGKGGATTTSPTGGGGTGGTATGGMATGGTATGGTGAGGMTTGGTGAGGMTTGGTGTGGMTTSSVGCGNGIVEVGEECDDGNQSNSDYCLNNCFFASCGDGHTYANVEECDDGDSDNSDACLNNCKLASCGDGYLQQGVEQCDDGNPLEGDGCYQCKPDCGCPGCTAGVTCANCGPNGAAAGFFQYKSVTTKHCYLFVPTTQSWGASRTTCMGWGGDLCAPSTQAELTEVSLPALMTAITGSARCWIGGTDEALEGTWVWSNNEPYIYVNDTPPWASGQPNGQTSDNCMVLGNSNNIFTLRDNNCMDNWASLCERTF